MQVLSGKVYSGNLILDVGPHNIEHLEGMLMENVSAVDIIPLIIQVCKGFVRLIEDVSIFILNKIRRLILEFVL